MTSSAKGNPGNSPAATRRSGPGAQPVVARGTPGGGGPSTAPSWQQTVPVPRWVVYLQGGMLGLVAFLFFLFGMLVGQWTTDRDAMSNATIDCRVIGRVSYRLEGDLKADEGAVVFLLPATQKPDQRSPGSLVNPASFQALDNPAIDRIHNLGGAVVRADDDGNFDVIIDAKPEYGLEYYLWVVSSHKRGVDTASMSKEQFAVTGTFFIPVEDVVEDRSYFWMKLKAYEPRIDLPEIEF